MFSREIGENLAGRTGGAVSLAVGMAHIFRNIPGMDTLVSYWYHYAIMFEALFILTTIDTGTRVARYVMHELLGRVYKPFATTTWLPGNLISTACGFRLGLPDLDGQYFDHLAAVWHCQPVAGNDCAGGYDHVPDQYGQSEVRHGSAWCR